MTSNAVHDQSVYVRVPDDPPEVTPAVARALLDILVELTEIPVLEETPNDR